MERTSFLKITFLSMCTFILIQTMNSRIKEHHRPIEMLHFRPIVSRIESHPDKKIISLGSDEEINLLYKKQQDLERCSTVEATAHLADMDSFPLVALASQPRSGNSWARNLLRISSQYYTSSMYPLANNNRSKTVHNYKEKRGICTKTHYSSQKVIDTFTGGAILLIRNPRNVVVSAFMHQRIRNESLKDERRKLYLEQIQNNTDKWRDISLKTLRGWKHFYTTWIEHAKRVLVVHHDNLCENTYHELKRILNFLHLPINGYFIQCAVDLYPCHLREYFNIQPKFPDEIDAFIDKLNQTLKDKKLPPLPTYNDHRLTIVKGQRKQETSSKRKSVAKTRIRGKTHKLRNPK
ncbi:sialate:O-sulfotransferase 1-like [Apostichopus japonicus]|uniref:sialate:O-sulfotransferase 1-like n=1 Tax=Stichopus japonicus TaxID=307972 RepID=UPI003AB6FA81